MRDLSPWYAARQHMVDAVIADLYGTPQDVTLTEAPLERFVVGILHPRATDGSQDLVEIADVVPDSEGGNEPDAGYDPGVSFAHLRYPSTIGLTVGLDSSTSALEVEIEADRYESVGQATDGAGDNNPAPKPDGTWGRVHLGPVIESIDIRRPASTETRLSDGLTLRTVVRRAREGIVNVTLVLVNSFTRPEKGRTDAYCWFRPQIRVRCVEGEFRDRRPDRILAHMDNDERAGELLYRHQRHLAVGHGVAVTWEEAPRVTEVETTFFPQHDLLLAQAERADVEGLSMSGLAAFDSRDSLDGLVDAYESWIRNEEDKILDLEPRHVEVAQDQIAAAKEAARRMRRGVELVANDEHATRAFRAMNSVMREQRVRQEMIRQGLSEPPEDVPAEWRPFQMAFILLNLEGLTSADSPDRDLADLLWFPTGGGKTEAYLGLIAYTLVHRRLRGSGVDQSGAGTGVLMRYTLRLLTLQQFERAAGLVCALEDWRAHELDMRDKAPFSIGLWVGQGATPNTVADAAKAIRKRRALEDPGDLGDPVQLLRCPWCGFKLSPEHYDADTRLDRLFVRCGNAECRFARGEGLPVYLVDADVYSQRPSLLIGTVDKFAMLAWRSQSGRIFGGPTSDAPPDLIVQDELHLISGPLGTLVGLYETAVDHLASDRAQGGRRPKLIASTATIRRASDQVRAVFDREARQFPPPGVDAHDSFFAVDAAAEVKGSRRYVGLLAPSTSHSTLLVRTYAALLQAAYQLDADDEVRDAYWTLLGYFNSLRVLGAAYIQSIDDVRDRIKVVAGRATTKHRETRDPRELTSRKKSSEIPVELETLQKPCWETDSADIVLATNMISVGVDVDRLGLMAVMGQPQTTSEYIQATSRVGRRNPGLVFTLYNASRSRDLSHYESFTTYHRALYKQVEATGATPFAPRALDRGLHGVLVILARHLISGAADDKSVAVPVETDDWDSIIKVITDRAASVSPDSVPDVREALRTLIDHWASSVAGGELQQYPRWPKQKGDVRALMVAAGASGLDQATGEVLAEIFPPADPPWATLTSLRNVDRESTLKIISSKRTKAVSRGEQE